MMTASFQEPDLNIDVKKRKHQQGFQVMDEVGEITCGMFQLDSFMFVNGSKVTIKPGRERSNCAIKGASCE